MDQYTGRQMDQYTGRQMDQYTGSQMCQYTGSQMDQYKGRQMDQYKGRQMDQYTGRQMDQYTGRQMDHSFRNSHFLYKATLHIKLTLKIIFKIFIRIKKSTCVAGRRKAVAGGAELQFCFVLF